jgi:hypothetical protein
MSEKSDRIQDALAAHLEYLEMGGSRPDTSHLTPAELEQLNDLIDALGSTEGIAFGLGRGDEPTPMTPPFPVTDHDRKERADRVVGQLRDSVPADVRIDREPVRSVTLVGGIEILEGWIVGTFGGRVRVWLLAVETAQDLEGNSDCLVDLNRVFGALPDTTAVALVAADMSCLIVQPEDCAPQIHIPSGSLVGRRYKQPIRPVGEAVSAFLNELIPYWDPVPAFDPGTRLTIDVPTVSKRFASAAIERQKGIGARARKGNPKKDVLLALGEKEISALTRLANGLFDGSVEPEEIEARIEGLAEDA